MYTTYINKMFLSLFVSININYFLMFCILIWYIIEKNYGIEEKTTVFSHDAKSEEKKKSLPAVS